MRFEHPQLLWLLPLGVPLLAAFFWWAWRAKRRALTAFVSARLLPGLTESVSPSRQKLRMALIVTSATLLLIALARPQLGFSWDEAKSRGLDVVVAVDTSKSMLAADVAPNRLKRAQLAALDLKRLARGDRFGLVAFAGSAFLQCPLTVDNEVYRQSVESLDVNIIPQGGTALAEAIQAARGAFKKKNDNHKVLVIFTDGEDHDGNAVESARAVAKDGMRIFTIGVGTPEGELPRVTDTQGRTEFLKDSDGNVVRSRLNEDLLKQIAQETGGFYMRMSGANTMDLLYERGLAPLPRGEIGAQRIKRYHERYQWVLGAAIVLLLLEMFLPERQPARSTSNATRGRGVTAAAKAAILLLLVISPSVASASAGRALKEYKKGQYEQALSNYEDALKKKPDDARLHYNAGAAAFQNKDYAQAIEHLNSALVTQDLGLQQRSYYNIGNSQFRLGQEASEPDKRTKLWEQAVKSFDSALKLAANDADAQFNQEFVKRKLEELKKQQQQQQDQKQDKDDKKDQDKKDQQQQNKDQQSKEDQQKQKEQQDKQQKPSQDQQQKDQQGQKPEDQQAQQQKQKEQQQASKPEQKPGEKDKGKQASKAEDKEGQESENAGDPQGTAMMRMTPEQAIRLLEAFKADEKNMPFRPILKTNRQDRAFKDW